MKLLKKHIVHIFYPGEYSTGYVLESNDSVESLLEQIFSQWNHGSGKESEFFLKSNKRSFSVGDVVMLDGIYWQCKSIGWKQIETHEFVELENAVLNHPYYGERGPWCALNEVMYQKEKQLV